MPCFFFSNCKVLSFQGVHWRVSTARNSIYTPVSPCRLILPSLWIMPNWHPGLSITSTHYFVEYGLLDLDHCEVYFCHLNSGCQFGALASSCFPQQVNLRPHLLAQLRWHILQDWTFRQLDFLFTWNYSDCKSVRRRTCGTDWTTLKALPSAPINLFHGFVMYSSFQLLTYKRVPCQKVVRFTDSLATAHGRSYETA